MHHVANSDFSKVGVFSSFQSHFKIMNGNRQLGTVQDPSVEGGGGDLN